MRIISSLVCALLLTFACAQTAAAQSSLRLSLGAGVTTVPYKSYDAQWGPAPLIAYEGERFYVRNFSAGIKLLDRESVEISAFAAYDAMSFDASKSSNHQLRALSDRNSSAVLGLAMRWKTPYGTIHVRGAQDVLGKSKGQNAALSYSYTLLFDRFDVTPIVGIEWNSEKYNDYYYGVDNKDSWRSGLRTYDADSGIDPYLALAGNYHINDAWAVFCASRVSFLGDAIKDSPMVDKSATYSLSMGVSYKF